MRTSLVTKLAALVGGIIILSAIVLAIIVHRATSAEFVTVMREELPQASDPEEQERVADVLEAAYSRAGIRGIDSIVRLPADDSSIRELPFVVVGQDLQVIATTEPQLENAIVTRMSDGGLQLLVERRIDGEYFDIELAVQSPRQLLAASGELFGELILLPEPVDEETGGDFAVRVWKDAAPWLAAVLAFAVIATICVLRRALRPIDSLTQAACELGDGEFPGKLETNSGSAEFDKLIGTFNSATEALAKTDEIRRRLISDIAHELRTPVTNIRGQLEAVQGHLIEPDDDFRTTLQQETRLLERLVQDFQEIAISDAGQLRLTLQTLPLRETVDNILAPMVQRAAATLRNIIPPAYKVVVDEERLGQVLSNLFDNAWREMPVALEITTSARISEEHVVMCFEDNGPGVAESDRQHIFDRFYRAERSRNRATGGAGLGLTIVKGLVEAMGGTIRYETGTAGGAAFLVTLRMGR